MPTMLPAARTRRSTSTGSHWTTPGSSPSTRVPPRLARHDHQPRAGRRRQVRRDGGPLPDRCRGAEKASVLPPRSEEALPEPI